MELYFFDINDTLTTDGALTTDADTAIGRLKAAGFIVVPITGRPAGVITLHGCDRWMPWSVKTARSIFAMTTRKKMQRRIIIDAATRAIYRQRRNALAAQILSAALWEANSSTGAAVRHEVVGEVRQCLIYSKQWDLSTTRRTSQALAANDACWRKVA